MPTRKIADLKCKVPCADPDHDPPSMMVLPDGLWEHECPTCGHRQVFRVSKPTLSTGDVKWVTTGQSKAAVRFRAGGRT